MSDSYDFVVDAMETLVRTVRAAEAGIEFANPELEFFCEHVIENRHDPSIEKFWIEFRKCFGNNGGD